MTSQSVIRGLAAILSFAPALSMAEIIVDGMLDPEYGAPVAVQTVETQFGDATSPGGGGSELDAVYAKVEGGRLYLLFTGNQEPNGNRLDVYFDSVAGGENTLSGVPQYGGSSSNLVGFTFDTGFAVDYHLTTQWFSNTGAYQALFVNRGNGTLASVPGSSGATPDASSFIASGTILAGSMSAGASGTALTQDLAFAINDNNIAGVSGGMNAANAAAAEAVTTGMEFSFALADLSNPVPGSTILISAMINNGDWNYLSNQILGGLTAPQGNLGGDGSGGFIGNMSGVDFNNFSGNQYFAVTVPVPEPGTWSLLAALGALGLAVLCRRGK